MSPVTAYIAGVLTLPIGAAILMFLLVLEVRAKQLRSWLYNPERRWTELAKDAGWSKSRSQHPLDIQNKTQSFKQHYAREILHYHYRSLDEEAAAKRWAKWCPWFPAFRQTPRAS